MPIFLSCFIIFVIWLRYEISKSKKASKQISDDFWTKEQQSNFVRKVDITNLNYVVIPENELPFIKTEEEEINKLQDQLTLIIQKKLLNLSSYTNTELKLKYGTSNLTLLSEYDQNFTSFIQILNKWATLLYEKGYCNEAKKALELGIAHDSDISSNYILLATIYKNNNNLDGITNLIKKAEGLTTLMKDSILQSLNNIKNS